MKKQLFSNLEPMQIPYHGICNFGWVVLCWRHQRVFDENFTFDLQKQSLVLAPFRRPLHLGVQVMLMFGMFDLQTAVKIQA